MEVAVQYNAGTLEGNNKKTNSAYKKLDAIFRELKTTDRLDILLELQDHENTGVRLWSGTHVLPLKEEVGLQTLKEIASNDGGLYSFDAKMTIQEWKKGNLTYLVE